MTTRLLYAEPLWTDNDFEAEVFGTAAEVHRLHVDELAELDPALRDTVDGFFLFRHFMTPETLALFPNLKAIVRLGVGYDRIDRQEAARRGITVCNVPDYGTSEVADHAIALAMGLSRGAFLHYDLQRGTDPAPWAPLEHRLLRRSGSTTFAVLGLGRIGMATALKAKGIGFDVVFHDPYLPNGAEIALGIRRAGSLDELLEQASILSLHTPLTRETRGLIGKDEIDRLPKDAIIVNTARGPILDLDAAGAALRSGKLAGLGLDVIPQEPPKEPLPEILAAYRAREPWLAGRLVVTPHIAFCSPDASVDLHRKAVETMHEALTGHSKNEIRPDQE